MIRRALVALICALPSVAARAAAHIDLIDMGTPNNGATVMNGWRGVIVRVLLDGGLPITRLDDISFFGNIAHRWADPTGQGKYTQSSPGPLAANNTFDSDFNFDSHLLGTPDKYVVRDAFEVSQQGFLTSRTGLPSDGFTGYGAAPYVHYEIDPVLFAQGSLTHGSLDVNPPFQSSTIDMAYVVTDSAFQVHMDVFSGDRRFRAFDEFRIPEPGTLWGAAVAVAAALLRRRESAHLGLIRSEPGSR
jgi:hypothetical protein